MSPKRMSMCSPPSGLPAISPSGGEISQSRKPPISPLEGKMAGRPEGGAPATVYECKAN